MLQDGLSGDGTTSEFYPSTLIPAPQCSSLYKTYFSKGTSTVSLGLSENDSRFRVVSAERCSR